MAEEFSFGKPEVRIGFGETAKEADVDDPFKLLLVGSFSGRKGSWKPMRVDLDNLDTILSRLSPEVEVPGAGSLKFRELEDFHPDRIFERIPRFRDLRDAAERGASRRETRRGKAELLDSILSGGAGEEEPVNDAPEETPEQAMTSLMRRVLHSPKVRAIERAWRGVDFLLKRMEADGTLSLHLLDIGTDELRESLSGSLDKSPLHKLLVEETIGTPGGQPFAAVAMLHEFDDSREDAELLGRLVRVAVQAGTPVIGGATAAHVGCTSLIDTPDPDDWTRGPDREGQAAWTALRALPEAHYAALALPRLLLRQPYGKKTGTIDAFELEELSSPAKHEEFLWGSPALGPLLLLGQGFLEDGWRLRPGAVSEIPDMPLPMYAEDGETRLMPPSEIVLTVRAAQKLGNAGLIPLLSLRESDAVRVGIFQSIAEPPAPLAGRWPMPSDD